MNNPLADLGKVIDLRSLQDHQLLRQCVLVDSGKAQVTHFIIPKGEEIPTHEAHGEIVIHCLTGQVLVTALKQSKILFSDHILCLAADEPFSIRATQDAALLATIILPKDGKSVELIGN